ncbi:hypothetical protein PAMP_002431 [Pampus punctatissimus]
MELKPLLHRLGSTVRAILTFLFALVVLGVMVWAYVEGFQLVTSVYGIISFGFYGLLLSLHLLVQSFFAFIEHRRMRACTDPCSFTKTIGFTISAYQEDPVYLRECLNSIRALKYPPELLRIIMVVDGNSYDDRYMMEMFREVFADQEPGCYVWKNNYHTWDPTQDQQDVEMAVAMGPGGDADYTIGEDPQRKEVERLIQGQRCVCIMQKWGGKREVMYTAFKALGSSVDYIQVCDSDTKLDPLATLELCKVLESNPKYGAVGGDVMILNLKDSYISFMSSLRYTARSKCYTETPAQFLRWLNQQTRWTKSYFREWLYNAMWWHKHHLWMTYESIVSGVFPFFVTATIIQLFWTGTVWDILWILCCIQLIGLVKAAYACILRRDIVMMFMSLYSVLYMTSLLPAKYFAILTMNKSSWGTSGRRKIENSNRFLKRTEEQLEMKRISQKRKIIKGQRYTLLCFTPRREIVAAPKQLNRWREAVMMGESEGNEEDHQTQSVTALLGAETGRISPAALCGLLQPGGSLR